MCEGHTSDGNNPTKTLLLLLLLLLGEEGDEIINQLTSEGIRQCQSTSHGKAALHGPGCRLE